MDTILFIGAGNMGGAMIHQLLDAEFCTPESIMVADRNIKNTEVFERKGCMVSTNFLDFLPEAGIVVLAIKPQVFPQILTEISKKISRNALIVSIAAGVSISTIAEHTSNAKIVRIMPNTPLLMGCGVCGWHASSNVSTDEKTIIQKMLNCFGFAIECVNEDMIDAITGLSGSGPAYYFYLLENMAKKAESFGFSSQDSYSIALQTLLGAGKLAENSPHSFAELRANVTSKGGTTESAIDFFDTNAFASIWTGGMDAAYEKAKKLSTSTKK